MMLSRQISRFALAAVLVVGCAAPSVGAFADEAGGAGSGSGSASSAADSASVSTSAKKSGSSSSSADALSASKTDDKEEKAKKEEAEKKRSEADSLISQADSLNDALSKAQSEREAAERERDEAVADRDAAEQRLEEEREQLATLQEGLSDFAVDMYKQGGAVPYLDVMLGAVSYRDFLTAWAMMTEVSDRGLAMASEKRQVSEAIESEVAGYEERISQAERSMAVAESKRKQTEATQLALRLQAAKLDLEAAETLGDKGEIAKAKEAVEAAQKALDEAIERGLSGESVLSGDGVFTHPCPDATISSGFGYRVFDNSMHKGLDLAAPEGTPYYAAESGTVTAVTNDGGDNGGAGNWIVIDHGDGLVTKYMHSLVTFVSVGDHVERGQNIGLVGSTGDSTGPHLHFQVESNGTALDPIAFL